MSKLSKIADRIRNPKFSTGAVCAVTIAVILVANMILYVLGTTFGWYLYSPETLDIAIKSQSIESDFVQAGKDVEAGTRNKVRIIFCMDESELVNDTRGKYVLKTALQLQEKYGKLIEVDFVNITIMNDEISKYVTNPDGSKNAIRKASVIFECGNNFKVVNNPAGISEGYASFYTIDSDMTPTSYNGEEIISSMVLWVMRDEHPTAYFTTGHGESSSSSLTAMFSCAGYNLETVNLRDQANAGVPVGNGNIIVISNPLTDFEKGADGIKTEIEALDAFIKNGGKIYAAIDPYLEAKQLKNLKDLIKSYGIEISTVTNENGVTLSNIVRDTDQSITTDGYTVIAGFADNAKAQRIESFSSAYGTGKVLVREAARLNLTGNAYSVLETSKTSICEVGGAVTDRSGGYCVAAASFVGEQSSSRNGGIFVTSTAFISSDDVIVSDGYSNKDFLYAVMQEIFYAEKPPYGCGRVALSNTEMLKGLTMSTAKIYTVIACIIPATIAVLGAVIIIRRKNR